MENNFNILVARQILPHGSYLINLAQSDNRKQQQAYDCFLDDLKRCERLGIGLYNFQLISCFPVHALVLTTDSPGSTLGLPRREALARIAAMVNRAHMETNFIKTVLENMAGQGNVIGSKLEDLGDIITLIHDKSRVGVCVDTCHTFAAGYDLRTKETFDSFWVQFENVIGMKYLSAMHLNDSKSPLGSNRDLHENIGQGFLGLEAFRLLVNKKELEGIPLVLETPQISANTWVAEIAYVPVNSHTIINRSLTVLRLLASMIGREASDPEILEQAKELSKRGESGRWKASEAVEAKRTKLKKRAINQSQGELIIENK